MASRLIFRPLGSVRRSDGAQYIRRIIGFDVHCVGMGHRQIRVRPQGASERCANRRKAKSDGARFQEKLLRSTLFKSYRKTDAGGLVSVYQGERVIIG